MSAPARPTFKAMCEEADAKSLVVGLHAGSDRRRISGTTDQYYRELTSIVVKRKDGSLVVSEQLSRAGGLEAAADRVRYAIRRIDEGLAAA